MHPTDSQKVALRSHDGHFLAPQWGGSAGGNSRSAQPNFADVEATSLDPYYFTIVHFHLHSNRTSLKEEEDDEIERQVNGELAVVLYAEREKGDKSPGGFLSTNAEGQVYVAPLFTSAYSPSPSSLPVSGSPRSLRSSLGVSSGESREQQREEAVWVMRWYTSKWPAILAHLYAELHAATNVTGQPASTSFSPVSSSTGVPSHVSPHTPSSYFPAMSGDTPPASFASVDGPESSPLLSTQLQAVLQRMVDRARFRVQV
jgi:hypothetical protein